MFFPINPDVSNAKLVSLLMWIVPFVLLNGVKEELWFRGLFLKQYELFLGPYLANILQPLIFSVAHMSVEYTSVLLGFLVVTFFWVWFGVTLFREQIVLLERLYFTQLRTSLLF